MIKGSFTLGTQYVGFTIFGLVVNDFTLESGYQNRRAGVTRIIDD